jgi:muramoyltetrapeptide carboxypeptidase LdcA involved in peptidoglycan recycling
VKPVFPKKLKAGDEIRVIAPATSLNVVSEAVRDLALRNFKALGFEISFSANSELIDLFNSSSIQARVDDIHAAFSDPGIKAVFTALGGYNSNELLEYLDYDLIRENPKIFCGYSDITAIETAIHTKAGLVTYSGPHFSTFGMEKGLDYTLEYFRQCLMETGPYFIDPSNSWSDDRWYRDQQRRQFFPNEGYLVINEGVAEGKILGGNLCTLNLLQGTMYMPDLPGSILFLEDDYESHILTFNRDLQSLIHQRGFNEVNGLILGRFQKASEATQEKLIAMIKAKNTLDEIPVIANADFGHTTPQLTFPIGGRCRVLARQGEVTLEMIEH